MSPRKPALSLLTCAVLSALFSVPVVHAQTANTTRSPKNTGDELLPEVVIIAENGKSATKSDTKIKEIPQAISVVSKEEIRQSGANGVDAALRTTAGVTAQSYGNDSRTDWLLVRGFNPSRYLDGMALPNGTWTADSRIEPYGLESIEVLKGPSSLLYGQIPPGGMVNLLSKKPSAEAIHEFEAQVGTRDHKQVAFDYADTFDPAHRVEYRLTALFSDGKAEVDHVKDQRYFIAPSLKYHLNSNTDFTLLTRYQYANTALGGGFLPSEGTLTDNPNGQISRRLFTGEPGYDSYKKQMASAGYEFEHRFSDDMSVRQNLRYAIADVNHKTIGTFGFVSGSDSVLSRYVYPLEENSKAFTVDNQLLRRWNTGAVTHQLLAGFDYRNGENDYRSGFGFGVGTLDAYHPVYGSAVTTPAYTYHVITQQQQYGLYAQDQMSYQRWNATLGIRRDWADTKNRDMISDTTSTQNDQAWSGRAALGYALSDSTNLYGAYSTSFQPTIGNLYNGGALTPSKGKQYEFGVKYQPTSQSLITAAIYDLKQTNVSTVDPNHVFFVVQQGEIHSKGAEFEAKYQFNRNLNLRGSYTYTDAKISKTTNAADLDSAVPLVPRQQASAGATYQFTDSILRKLSLSADVRRTGKHYGATGNLYQTPAYTLVDVGIGYQLQRWQLQLNVSNLFDKTYVSACNQNYWCYYGQSRDIKLTARYTF